MNLIKNSTLISFLSSGADLSEKIRCGDFRIDSMR